MIITLVPKEVASTNYKFKHIGAVKECKSCNLRQVCVDSLEKNKFYEINKMRKKEHKCPIDNRKMRICEVEETQREITFIENEFMDGVIITRTPIECEEILCKHYEKCKPEDIKGKKRIKIEEKIEKIDCPLKYNLIKAKIKKIS